MVVNAFCCTQPLDQLQVGFTVLQAVFALYAFCLQVKAEGVLQTMFFQHLGDDLRGSHVLKDT